MNLEWLAHYPMPPERKCDAASKHGPGKGQRLASQLRHVCIRFARTCSDSICHLSHYPSHTEPIGGMMANRLRRIIEKGMSYRQDDDDEIELRQVIPRPEPPMDQQCEPWLHGTLERDSDEPG